MLVVLLYNIADNTVFFESIMFMLDEYIYYIQQAYRVCLTTFTSMFRGGRATSGKFLFYGDYRLCQHIERPQVER